MAAMDACNALWSRGAMGSVQADELMVARMGAHHPSLRSVRMDFHGSAVRRQCSEAEVVTTLVSNPYKLKALIV